MNQPDVHLPVGRGDDRPGRLIRGNPILVKEIRALFRQKRSWSILTFCLVAVGGITLLLYVSMLATNAVAPDPDIRRKLGRAIFYAITLFQFIAISLVAPPFTADTITSEQEENTLDLLRTTAVPAGSIIRGKLLAGEVYTLLILVICLPVQSSVYLIGGLAPLEYLASIALLFTTTFFLCSLGIWASARSDRTSSAIGQVTILSGVLMFGLPVLMYVIIRLSPYSIDQAFNASLHYISRYPNPILQTILTAIAWILVSSNPVSAAVASNILLLTEGAGVWYNLASSHQVQFSFLPPWITCIILLWFFSWLFNRQAVRHIEQRSKFA